MEKSEQDWKILQSYADEQDFLFELQLSCLTMISSILLWVTMLPFPRTFSYPKMDNKQKSG